jgi:hypothetical protein
MKTAYRSRFMGALLVTALFAATVAAQPRVQAVALDDPPQLFGTCNPTRVHFTGRINATGPMDVNYQWIRSDNAAAQTQVLHFIRAGQLTINYDWTVGGNSTGWVALRILPPQQLESKHVAFHGNCGH